MSDQFHVFAKAVRKQFDSMAKDPLFVVDSDREIIWMQYLLAFPEGTDPIFRKRTEHDCSCCRNFIRNVGNLVTLSGSTVNTVWDVTGLPHPYQEVADAMATYVRGLKVRDVFLTPFSKFGQEKSIELVDGVTHQWNHFSAEIPTAFVKRVGVAEARGDSKTTQQVLLRGLRELTSAAVATVLDLIRENALYRGAEHKRSVEAFAAIQQRFLGINDPEHQERLTWQMLNSPVARFRNTVIGTLVQDLSEGVDLEKAVRTFEAKVAPQNYKRPTALITKSMVDAATKTIAELGLEEALERRHARFSDVSINAVLFVDNSVAGTLKGGISQLLMQEVKPAPFDPSRAEEITVKAFTEAVLPKLTGLKAYVENTHSGNFVSLTAPVHEGVAPLFRWGNNFAWSYDGNVTDSIKEKVKRAGGRVEDNKMRVSLAWYNFDDLDLHVMEPDGNHVYFANKSNKLDVDMNAGHGTHSRTPVENVRWIDTPKNGTHKVWVNQFSRREATNVGFEIEFEANGVLHHSRFEKGLAQGRQQAVMDIVVNTGVITVKPAAGMISGALAQEKWGVKTLDLVKVQSVLLSPNHWDGNAVGNKHWFFILEGCKNPVAVRGIYNEFLGGLLEKHRKVFEVLGDKTKCPPADEQLSGLGFSSTQQNKVSVIAMGPGLNKAYTIVFGKEE